MMTRKSAGTSRVGPSDDQESRDQLEIVQTAGPPKLRQAKLTTSSKVSIGADASVVIDVQSLVASLYPWEMTKHFHHAVREGDAHFVGAAIGAKLALIDSLDDRLMCPLSYSIKYRRLEVLQLLLRAGAALNLRGQEGTRPIHLAATFDARDAMQLLLQQKSLKIDVADDKGQTALHVACRRSHIEIARLLLQSGADVLKQEKDGVSALHQPARNGSLELCGLLLSSGANVNAADNNGLTPVMVACIEGRFAVLKELLRLTMEKIGKSTTSSDPKKLLLERQDNDGSTALHHATQNRQMEILACLLDAGVNVNAKRNDGNTPLHIAASLGYQDVVEILLSNGADPSALDKKKRTPLHECGLNNQPNIAMQLIVKGSNVNAADDQFMSPLHWACRRGHRPVADTLLEFCARLDGHDVNMRTPLHWAVIEDNDAIVERLLETPGIESVSNKQDMYDKTPLHYAAERGCAALARRLVHSGADCTIVDGDERRPSHVAAKTGHLDCLRVLIEATAGVSVDHRDQDERTTVLLAAEEGRFEVFHYLCAECGADFSAKDDVGRNSLMLAVAKSHYEIAKFLLDRDMDINATDVNKNTALHYAAKEDSTGQCVRLLLEYAAMLTENNNKETAVDFAILVSNREALEVFFGEQYWVSTMAYRRENGRTHMDQLIQHSPEFAKKILDYGIETTVRDPMDKNFAVIYNYSLIDPGPDDPASQPHRYLALMTMARYKQLDLLKHPLSMAVMQEKWQKFACASLWIDILFYVLFVACLTIFVVDQGPLPPHEMDEYGCRNTSAGLKPTANSTVSIGGGGGRPKLTNPRIIAEKSIITSFLLIRILLELLKLFHKRLSYFKSVEVYFYLSLYFSTFLFMYPPDSEPCMWNWMFGLVSIVLAWSLVLFQIECIPKTGLYSLMFQKVLISLVKVLLVFGFFIMAFAMAFYSSMRSSTPFRTVPYAILKTFDMTVGELEFVTYFITADYGNFQTAVQCLFVAFVIIMPIALMNLLIGVAVGDIEGITRDAEQQLLTIRINLIYEVETNSPRYFQRRLHRSHKEVYPNRTYTGLKALFRSSYEDDYRAYKTAQRAELSGDKLELDSSGLGEAVQQQTDRIAELEQNFKNLTTKLDAFMADAKR